MSQPQRRGGFLNFVLTHPWWSGLAGIATVFGLIVAIIQLTSNQVSPPPSAISGDCNAQGDGNEIECQSPASDDPPATTSSGGIVGDCNAQGVNNDVSCRVYPPEPASLGAVDVSWAGFITYFFEGKPEGLPIPPDYPAPEVRGHCDEWEGWLASEQRIYTMAPTILMSVLSGQNDVVAVTSIESTIFKKRPIDNESFTIIQCQYGAGGAPGTLITTDVATGETELFDSSDENPMPMPPAALTLSGANYQGALVKIKSSSGFLYSGRLRITALINGSEQVIELGTPERPFRWVGGDPGSDSYPEMQGDTRWDWNPKTKQWVPNLNPEDVYPQ